jgi:hypothetical protein
MKQDMKNMKSEIMKNMDTKVLHYNEMDKVMEVFARLADRLDAGKVAIDHQAADGVPADLQKQ